MHCLSAPGAALSWWWQEAEAWREVQPRGRLQMDDLNAITQAAIAGFGLPGCRPGWRGPTLSGASCASCWPDCRVGAIPSTPSGPMVRICPSRPGLPSTGWRAACPEQLASVNVPGHQPQRKGLL